MKVLLYINLALIFFGIFSGITLTANSDQNFVGMIFLLYSFLVSLFTLFTIIILVIHLIKQKISLKYLGKVLVVFFIFTSLICVIRWKMLHPQNIKYEFKYGNTGSWASVQFYFKENEIWLKGPWVGKYNLKVRFPDLNSDGYKDIVVYGQGGGRVKFIYLHENDDKCSWKLLEKKGYETRNHCD